MKAIKLIGLVLIISAFGLQGSENEIYPSVVHNTFEKGEELEYKLNFGIFTVGKAKYVIRDNVYKINTRPSYKIDVYGKTTGMVDWVANVDDHWWAYVDTTSLLPHISARRIREAGYRRDEIVRFDHQSKMIEAKVLNQKTKEFKEPRDYQSPYNEIRDILGGLLYFRTLPVNKMQKGDTIKVDSFFEDSFYNFEVVMAGKEVVKTKMGKFRAIKLYPVMPENDIFDGESSVWIWISDDENKIPLKAEAEMFIGSAGAEIIGFSKLRNQITSFIPD